MDAQRQIKKLQENIANATLSIAQAQTQIDELKKKLSEVKWIPKLGDLYYYISSGLKVMTKTFDPIDAFDSNRLSLQNCYQTREIAEKMVFIKETEADLCDLIRNINDGWTPDFTDPSQDKYIVYFDYSDNKLKMGKAQSHKRHDTKFMCKRDFLRDLADQLDADDLINYFKTR